MIYLRQHPEFIEGSQYMDKYAQLLSRALALVKNQVNSLSKALFGGEGGRGEIVHNSDRFDPRFMMSRYSRTAGKTDS